MAPRRTCIGCRRTASADQLVRVVGAGGLRLSPVSHGRGAWLCPDVECFDRAVSRRAFGRALRTEIDPGAMARLRDSFVSEVGNVRGWKVDSG